LNCQFDKHFNAATTISKFIGHLIRQKRSFGNNGFLIFGCGVRICTLSTYLPEKARQSAAAGSIPATSTNISF
jgi:hypothetical protein